MCSTTLGLVAHYIRFIHGVLFNASLHGIQTQILVHGVMQYRNIYGTLLCAFVCNVCDKHNIGILSFGVCTIIWYDGMVGHGIVPYGMDV